MKASVALKYVFSFSLAHALIAGEKTSLNLPAIPPIEFAPKAKLLVVDVPLKPLPKSGLCPPRSFNSGLMWQCGGILILKARPPLDPIPPLCDAYRDVECVEVWRLERAVDTFAYPRGFWGKFVYRDTAIAQVVQHNEYHAKLEAFQIALDALSVGEDEDCLDISDFESPTLEGSIESFGFIPDLVITFIGLRPARVEFDLFRRRALLTASGKWGFYNIDEFALQRLRRYEAKTAEAPGESPEPTTTAITSVAGQRAR